MVRKKTCSYLDQPQPGSGIYVDQKPYGSQGPAPFTIILDGNNPEQRVPLQVLVYNFIFFIFFV